MKRSAGKLLAFVSFTSSPALAGVCLEAYGSRLDAQLGQITQKTPLFLEAVSGVTCARSGTCGTRGYLLPGDPVVVYARKGGWACVEFTATNGRPTGWRSVPDRTVKPVQGAGDPRGSWVYGDQSLFVRRSGNRLLVRGWSQWPWAMGATPAVLKRLEESGPNVGQVQEKAPWVDGADRFSFGKRGGCLLKVRSLGPYLLAEDNDRCGGFRVTFSGTYRRTSPTVSEADWKLAATPSIGP